MRVILSCNRYTEIKLMLDCVNVLSVRQTIQLNTMIFIYKILHNLLPSHLLENCVLVHEIHEHFTRTRNNFFYQQCIITTVKMIYSTMDLNSTMNFQMILKTVEISKCLKQSVMVTLKNMFLFKLQLYNLYPDVKVYFVNIWMCIST